MHSHDHACCVLNKFRDKQLLIFRKLIVEKRKFLRNKDNKTHIKECKVIKCVKGIIWGSDKHEKST